ncbi:gibberellin-regulated protein 5-like [Gastrolobium bilobum]|uniref:gibberellin-regulated protein 5-like n=1 Tax=Gastrolobium bilobum TaxID=150636 RepID=UPI002AB2DBE3|nr:gibberellin-regulated protein 5-like [Gastrolobium bilobum]XP_061368323.1 gibberellin-regulated protein 5-like [Gastrolobium bilobum]
MARILSIVMLCLVAMLLLHVESHAEIVVSPMEASAPQPMFKTFQFQNGTTEGSLQPEECGPRCAYRCSNTGHKKPCMFFCQKCCEKCLCVPPGTYGNKEVCPCYNNWKTKRGGPKCP